MSCYEIKGFNYFLKHREKEVDSIKDRKTRKGDTFTGGNVEGKMAGKTNSKEADIKVSFSNVTMQKTAFREMKENLMYLLGKYDGIMRCVVGKTIKQGKIHENMAVYLQKTEKLSENIESMFETVEKQMEQWKEDFEEADEELYEE